MSGHAPPAVAAHGVRLRGRNERFETGAGVRGQPARTYPIDLDAVACAGTGTPIVAGEDPLQMIDLVQRQTGGGAGGAQAGAEFGARGQRQARRQRQHQAAPSRAGRQCQAGGGEREPGTCKQQNRGPVDDAVGKAPRRKQIRNRSGGCCYGGRGSHARSWLFGPRPRTMPIRRTVRPVFPGPRHRGGSMPTGRQLRTGGRPRYVGLHGLRRRGVTMPGDRRGLANRRHANAGFSRRQPRAVILPAGPKVQATVTGLVRRFHRLPRRGVTGRTGPKCRPAAEARASIFMVFLSRSDRAGSHRQQRPAGRRRFNPHPQRRAGYDVPMRARPGALRARISGAARRSALATTAGTHAAGVLSHTAGGALVRIAAVFLLLSLPGALLPLPRTLLAAGPLAALQAGLLLIVIRFDLGIGAVDWRMRWRDAGEAVLIAAAMAAALAAVTVLTDALPEPVNDAVRRGHRWRLEAPAQVPAAAAFVVAGAYREELYFRVYCLSVLQRAGTPAWLAVLGSALLFGAGHLYQGWVAAAFAVLMGSTLAMLFQRRPGLHRLVFAHALFNAMVLAGTLFAA